MGDVRDRNHDEPAFVLAQAVLDARPHILEVERVLVVGAMRVAHRDARLADPLEPSTISALWPSWNG